MSLPQPNSPEVVHMQPQGNPQMTTVTYPTTSLHIIPTTTTNQKLLTGLCRPQSHYHRPRVPEAARGTPNATPRRRLRWRSVSHLCLILLPPSSSILFLPHSSQIHLPPHPPLSQVKEQKGTLTNPPQNRSMVLLRSRQSMLSLHLLLLRLMPRNRMPWTDITHSSLCSGERSNELLVLAFFF